MVGTFVHFHRQRDLLRASPHPQEREVSNHGICIKYAANDLTSPVYQGYYATDRKIAYPIENSEHAP
jgi:hypothetical protein